MIELKKLEDKNIYQFKIEGKLDEKSVHDFYSLLKEKSEKHETIKMMGVIKEMPSFENFKAFTETMKMKAQAIKGVARYAILSDKHWLEIVLPIGNFVTPGIPVKHFHLGEEAAAISWLESDEK